jgi:N6-adenosine-specific RNA methylase IME4
VIETLTGDIITVQENSDWYQSLVDDCKAIITEAVFTSRWALVEGYHQLGQRIATDESYQEYAKGNRSSVQDLARKLSTSPRSLYYAIQFYEKYPSLDGVPEGKNISWNKLLTKYLPDQRNIETPELPTVSNGTYRVIYADPPWKYGNNMPEYFGEQADHYGLMSIDEICALPVKDMAEDNAVLFLWATSPILEESFEVIKAWGFKYKASFVWDKVKHNMGHYNSVRHEFLLVCTRGSCLPDEAKLFDSVQSIERTEHSRKPEEFREIIDTIYPNGKRIELFARRTHDSWDAWGNQVT